MENIALNGREIGKFLCLLIADIGFFTNDAKPRAGHIGHHHIGSTNPSGMLLPTVCQCRSNRGEAKALGALFNELQLMGMNVAGDDVLDAGLRGRGVVGSLPQPRCPGDKSGKIVIRVTVDKTGRVTSAEFQAKGSTLSDPAFIEAAKSAALRARFRESSAEIMGGQITYKFNLN